MDSRDEVASEELLVDSVEDSEEGSKAELLEDTKLEDSEELLLTVSSKLVSPFENEREEEEGEKET